jgi:hypothetical protein
MKLSSVWEMAVTALTDTVAFSPAAALGPGKRRMIARAHRKMAPAGAAISRDGTSSSAVIRTAPSTDLLHGAIYETLK